MSESNSYAVYLFPQAAEALGEVVKPYLSDGVGGAHVLCTDIEMGGPFFEMTVQGTSADGRKFELDLMVPMAMIRCVVSVRGAESEFGFT